MIHTGLLWDALLKRYGLEAFIPRSVISGIGTDRIFFEPVDSHGVCMVCDAVVAQSHEWVGHFWHWVGAAHLCEDGECLGYVRHSYLEEARPPRPAHQTEWIAITRANYRKLRVASESE